MVRAFRTAMTGVCRDRPELAATAIPLELRVTPLPLRGPDGLVHELFEPLGWATTIERIAGPSGPSRYVELTLRGTARVADALNQLYVLIPALDEDKHYWVGDDEVEKLLARGGEWLAAHPARETIARRYLKRRRDLVRFAMARLAPEEEPEDAAPLEAALEAPARLHDARLDIVADALRASGASVVADLGCGEGRLIKRLLREKQFTRIIGLDVASRALAHAAGRLDLDGPRAPPEGRVTLLQGALTYRDDRWREAEAAALVEVIEHLDPDRVPMAVEVIFGDARPKTVIVTTPNADYNSLFPTLPAGAFRHPDHRFEWSRQEFAAWAADIETRFGYRAEIRGIGPDDPELGAVTQMAVFQR
jgi:3' terminal RNA ribose 2'-O-methyltransferase Hen1